MLISPDLDLAALSAELKEQINSNSIDDAAEDQDFRWHLGISIIGRECHRAIFYSFRWFTPPKVAAHTARLYARGHDEEAKIVAMLQRDGWTVQDRDPATGKQWLYSAVNGHYGGSCDGIAYPPKRYNLGGVYSVLLEMKTHNTKSFSNFVAKGLIESKPQHHTQMCGYAYAFLLDYGLYFPVNKNDDDIQPTFVKLDREYGKLMELRAESIITSPQPPAKISTKPTHFVCKMCEHWGVCHGGDKAVEHCRSCRNSQPTLEGNWWCNIYAAVIPRDVVRKGCGVHYKAIVE